MEDSTFNLAIKCSKLTGYYILVRGFAEDISYCTKFRLVFFVWMRTHVCVWEREMFPVMLWPLSDKMEDIQLTKICQYNQCLDFFSYR
jgi:hypothetical protein